MEKNTYIGWALFTGPKNPTPLWEKSRWISGEWNGEKERDKNISTEDQIKKDIDARIDFLIDTFEKSRKYIKDRSGSGSVTNYFVIPEFYFHCHYGPYPRIRIKGELPYEYICSTLQSRIKSINLELEADQKESWIICAGSALTCNIPDIEQFLDSECVKNRLNTLNKEIRNLSERYNYKTEKDFKKNDTHIKAKSYMEQSDSLSGTEQAINALMDEFRAAPLCVVRNRGVIFKAIFSGQSGAIVQSWGYEKQNESTVDLTMGKLISNAGICELEHGGMITEWMAGYPSISIINGDKNTPKDPMAARITIKDSALVDKNQEIGVEICLDHRLERLRRTVGMLKVNGAAEDNPVIQVQLVPSGGMQILDYSVVAGISGVIFNCDGCDPILDKYDPSGEKVIPGSGTFKQVTCGVYASSAQTMVKKSEQSDSEHKYYSHTQLSFRYGDKEIDGYNNALGTHNNKGQTFDPETKTNKALDEYLPPEMIKVESIKGDSLFAAGLGDLHIYKVE
jgi:hypothetical protein